MFKLSGPCFVLLLRSSNPVPKVCGGLFVDARFGSSTGPFLSALRSFVSFNLFLRLRKHHHKAAINIPAAPGAAIPIIRGSFDEWFGCAVLLLAPVTTGPAEAEVDVLVWKVVGEDGGADEGADGSTVVVLSTL